MFPKFPFSRNWVPVLLRLGLGSGENLGSKIIDNLSDVNPQNTWNPPSLITFAPAFSWVMRSRRDGGPGLSYVPPQTSWTYTPGIPKCPRGAYKIVRAPFTREISADAWFRTLFFFLAVSENALKTLRTFPGSMKYVSLPFLSLHFLLREREREVSEYQRTIATQNVNSCFV